VAGLPGFEQGLAATQDGGESSQERAGGLVGEVGLVATVSVVPFGDAVTGIAFGLAVAWVGPRAVPLAAKRNEIYRSASRLAVA